MALGRPQFQGQSVTIDELRETLPSAVGGVSRSGGRLAVEEGGVVVAGLVPADDLLRLEQLDREWDARTRAVERFGEAFADVSADEAEAKVAEIIAERRKRVWGDEPRRPYDVRGNKRGLYVLAYARAAASNLAQIERDFTLSERVLRTLITRCDHLSEEQMRNAEAVQRTSDEAKLRREPVAAGGDGPEA